MKRISTFVASLFLSIAAFAQEADATEKTFWNDPVSHPMMPMYAVAGLVLIAFLLVCVVAIVMIRILNVLTTEAEKERAVTLGVIYTPKPGWWSRFSQMMNASVPLEQEKDIELDHNYDGIKELDNHLPPWWKWLFYGTIGWGVVYFFVFHISDSLPLQTDEYRNEVALAEEQSRLFKSTQPQQDIDINALAYTPDSANFILKGKSVFMENNCSSCHRNDGGGNMIGPNLTDEYWLHGGDMKEVFGTVKDGVVEKGMPAWGKLLSPQEVRDVTFYIFSLRGSNPENAKKPQGERYRSAGIQSDTTGTRASL